MATNLEFIKSASADNVTSLTLTDIFSANYDVYEIFIRGNGSQNVSSLTAEFLDSGGSDIGQGNYDTAIYRMHPGATFSEVRTTNAGSFEFAYPGSTDKDFGAKITVFNPFSSSSYTFANIQSMAISGEKNIVVATVTTSAVSMKFNANQHFTPVNVSVYGVK